MEYNQKTQKATRLIVDETQVVTSNSASAAMLLKVTVTYRKFGGICTFAIQNLSRALDNPDLRDMFSNCGYKCFLDQGGIDAQRLAEIQTLSEHEYQSLSAEEVGYGVMIWGKKIILLDARMSKDNVLYDLFSTNFHEKAAEKRAAEKAAESDTTNNEKFVPLVGTIELEKQKIMQMAALVPVSTKEIAVSLNLTNKEAQDMLQELCITGKLEAFFEAGEEFYRVVR